MSGTVAASGAASTGHQVDDQQDDRQHQQKVDQAPGDMEGKAKKP